jgi:hypothetical protein
MPLLTTRPVTPAKSIELLKCDTPRQKHPSLAKMQPFALTPVKKEVDHHNEIRRSFPSKPNR